MSKFHPQVADAGQYEGALRQQRITLGGAERSGAIWDAVTAAAASVAGSVPDSFRTDLLEVRALRSASSSRYHSQRKMLTPPRPPAWTAACRTASGGTSWRYTLCGIFCRCHNLNEDGSPPRPTACRTASGRTSWRCGWRPEPCLDRLTWIWQDSAQLEALWTRACVYSFVQGQANCAVLQFGMWHECMSVQQC